MNEQKSLTAKQISSIIRACKSSGVSELQFGDLLIKFGPIQEKAISPWANTQEEFFIPEETIQKITMPGDQEPEKEIDLEDLQITDPVAWEQLRIQG